uniref:Putative retrovirus-related gag protein n=1 Tax=Rattus norvegicus TaxID=10116 RepID=O70449_RAT|nr:putative retrovirus-related gag protein [Rattus norvegicus]
MGSSHSSPLLTALQELLNRRKLKVERKILSSFLDECDRCAPWFIVSGSLTLRAWDKLGRDLDKEATEGKLRPGSKPLWRIVRACLEDKRCEEVVRTVRESLQSIKKVCQREKRSQRKKGKEKETKGTERRQR